MTDKPQFVGKKVRLGDIVKIEKASMPSGNNVWVLNLDAVEKGTGKVIVKNRMKADSAGTSTVAFTADAVLYSKLRPNLNKVVVADEPGLATSEMLPLIVNPEVLDRRYFAYLLRSNSFVNLAVSSTAGSKMPRMNKKTLLNAVFPIPSLELQHQRIDLLSSIEKARTKAELLIQQLDTLVKSRFIEMFGDPIRNPLRMSVSSVEELAAPIKNSMKAGPFGSALKKEVYAESGYKVYGQEQVISGNQFLGNYYIDKEKYEQLNSCKVMPGDVLISLVGTVGKVLILSEDCQPGIINPRLVKITFDKRKIFPEYFAIAFSLESVRSSLLGRAHGQTMNVLNLGMIKKLKLPVPPISRQKEYLNFVAQVDKSRFGGMLHLLNSLSGIMHASFFSVADTD